MQTLKFSLIIISLITYFILCAIVRICLFWAKPKLTISVINYMTQGLMHVFCFVGNIKIHINGSKKIFKENGLFIICPHTGYLDGVILGTLVPGTFITKKEIQKTPILGHVVNIGGSIFIDRKSKSSIVDYVKSMSSCLEQGINIFNFPEGHATNGTTILPFFSAFFDAPLRLRSSIVPVTIKFTKVNGSEDFDTDKVHCYNGSSIFKHLWNFLGLKRIDIDLNIHPTIRPNGHLPNAKGRRDMSEMCMNRLAKYTNLPISKVNPLQQRTSQAAEK